MEEVEVGEKLDVKTEPKEHKELKAKTASLWAKIIGAIIIIGGFTLKWLNLLPNATQTEICICGFSVMGIFGTVDLNILIDKFTSKEK